MKTISMIAVFCFVLVTGIQAQDKVEATFGGVASCKACHLTKKSGAQYKLWKAGPHAKAFETLKTAAAKEVGAKLGVTDPATSDKCLKCHVTAHGVDAKLKGKKFTSEEGVGCESCHGAGSKYKGRKVMKAITAGTTDGATLGLVTPTEKTCAGCHNEENPTHKPFKFEEQVAKIAHPIPAAK